MRFLVVFAAVLGYAAAGLIAPLAYHANPGDVQAAVIDSTVAAQDHARAVHEGQARSAEAAIQFNTEAARQTAEAHRDINENAFWGSVVHNQNLVAAAQTQAAAVDGVAAAARGLHGYGGYAGYAGYAAPLAYGAPLGYHGLGYPGYY